VVAIARYYFYSVTGAIAPLLNLTNSSSDAINKVTVTHLWICNFFRYGSRVKKSISAHLC